MEDPFDGLGLQQGTKLGRPAQDGQAWPEAQSTQIGWGITAGQQQPQQQSNSSNGAMLQGGGGVSGSVPFQYSAGSAMTNNRNMGVNAGGLGQENPYRRHPQMDAAAVTAAAHSGAPPGGVYPPTSSSMGGFSGVSPNLQPSQPPHALGLPAAANRMHRHTTPTALPVASPTPAVAVSPVKQAARSTPLEWQGDSGVLTGKEGGAEWTPPADQLGVYERMFASASEGSAVPGTVSGRAAVQFFSRSGLPKDTLKSVRK